MRRSSNSKRSPPASTRTAGRHSYGAAKPKPVNDAIRVFDVNSSVVEGEYNRGLRAEVNRLAFDWDHVLYLKTPFGGFDGKDCDGKRVPWSSRRHHGSYRRVVVAPCTHAQWFKYRAGVHPHPSLPIPLRDGPAAGQHGHHTDADDYRGPHHRDCNAASVAGAAYLPIEVVPPGRGGTKFRAAVAKTRR